MKKRATETQVKSYAEVVADTEGLGAAQEVVLECVEQRGKVTRAQISRITGLRHSSATARVHELIQKDLLEVVGTVKDFETNKTVEVLSVKKKAQI